MITPLESSQPPSREREVSSPFLRGESGIRRELKYLAQSSSISKRKIWFSLFPLTNQCSNSLTHDMTLWNVPCCMHFPLCKDCFIFQLFGFLVFFGQPNSKIPHPYLLRHRCRVQCTCVRTHTTPLYV